MIWLASVCLCLESPEGWFSLSWPQIITGGYEEDQKYILLPKVETKCSGHNKALLLSCSVYHTICLERIVPAQKSRLCGSNGLSYRLFKNKLCYLHEKRSYLILLSNRYAGTIEEGRVNNNEIRRGLIRAQKSRPASMINCPDFDTEIENVEFLRIFNTLAVLASIIHFYTIYCIIFRSPIQMKAYRWYLLWHQIVSFSGDFWVACLFTSRQKSHRLMELQSQ